MRRLCFVLPCNAVAMLVVVFVSSAKADDWPKVTGVESQPLAAATERLIEALDSVGAPFSEKDVRELKAAIKETDAAKALDKIQAVLDPHCLVAVTINPESRVSVVEGPAAKELIQNGWRTFLVKVHNQAGITPELKLESPNVAPLFRRSTGAPEPKEEIKPADLPNRFLDAELFGKQPLKPKLSGLALEYRILQLYTRDAGKREAKLGFNVGQGTQDIGFRNAAPILFDCRAGIDVTLGIKDIDGRPATAALLIKDRLGHVYPNQSRRLAPDFFFQQQVYRTDGETITLPPGEFDVTISRGPEYVPLSRKIVVTADAKQPREEFQLQRWIHVAERRWFSGDHHIHAAGCAHYENPTAGVSPADMLRHIRGEDLNVGCVLTWGPCWYAQKQNFEGTTSALSRPPYLMRYDVEVSGFPSSHAGHLCLLKLKEDDFPDTTRLEEWPSWTLPILQWGQKQGGVVGYSHSGFGLVLPDYDADGKRVPVNQGRAADKLPDTAMPPFDGIGANEFIVTGVHGACDFISTVDTPAIWELNIWYHTLNCGLRTRISGETDFPCIYGDRVGLGRVYVKLGEKEEFNYDNWVAGLKNGRSYCGDGLSHLLDFRVGDMAIGEPDGNGKVSELRLDKPGKVRVTCSAAALLAAQTSAETEAIRTRRLDQKPYWHIERARVGKSREVPVEVIVNGQAMDQRRIVADGSIQELAFDIDVPRSAWIALRILPSAHTNPIWVEVADQPVRASKASAEWCAKAVDVCWQSKQGKIRAAERPAAKEAYDRAAAYYQKIAKEAAE